jgi:hypothetical protein
MTTFEGFDLDIYPGEAALLSASIQGFSWVAAYLEAPSHSNASWPDYPTLKATGLNVLPVWVGAQVVGLGSHDVGAAQGATEGKACVAELIAKGYPIGTGVAFDTENGPPIPLGQSAHLTAWGATVRAAGYRPMMYGSYLNFVALCNGFGRENVWTFEIRSEPPAIQGVAVQYQQEVPLTLAGKTYSVDRSVSTVADPAAPLAAQPVSAQVPSPAPPLASPGTSIPLGSGGVAQPSAAPPPSPWPMPPIPLTPSVPQLAPAFTPAPIAATGPTLSTVATPARVGATVALTGLLTGATAMSTSHIASVKDLIDLAFIYLVAPVVLGIVVGLATSLAKLLNINMQGALAQRVLTATENGAMALVSKAQTAADDHSQIATKNEMIAGVVNYANTAVPDAVKALGLATPTGQGVLANLAEAQVQKAVTAVTTQKATS